MLCSDRTEYDNGQSEEEGQKKMEEKGSVEGVGGYSRDRGRKDGEGGWGMRVMGVGCQSGGGGGWWNIQWECASGSFPLFFFFFRHLWLTVLFIGVPVVQGTHLQTFFLCTLSEIRERDKEWGRKRERRRGWEGEGGKDRACWQHWADIHEQLSSFVPEKRG